MDDGGSNESDRPVGFGPNRDVTLTVHAPTPPSGPPPTIPSPPLPVGGPAGVGASGGTPPWNVSGVVGAAAGTRPGDTSADGPRRRRGRLLGIGVAVVVLAAAAVTAVLLTLGGGGTDAPTTFSYTATGPWRLVVADRQSGDDVGCTVTPHGANPSGLAGSETVYGDRTFQVHQTGRIELDVTPSPPGCRLTAQAGGGDATLPFTVQQTGDSSAFHAPSAVEVQVKDFNGSETCEFVLRDLASGENVDFATATKDAPTVRLDPGGRSQVYLAASDCAVRIGAAG